MTMRLWGPPATHTRQIHAGPAMPGRAPHRVHQLPGGRILISFLLLTAAEPLAGSPHSARDRRSSVVRSPDRARQPCGESEAEPSGPRLPRRSPRTSSGQGAADSCRTACNASPRPARRSVAARDLEEIFDYVSRQNAPSRAEHVLDRIEEAFQALSAFPQRGSYPRELLDLGVREYREVFFKPYRIIYRVLEDGVYVMVIGRRTS